MSVIDDDRSMDVERVNLISSLIEPLLKGLHPGEQGAILADLLAIWLAGHPFALHDQLIEAHVRGVRRLIPLYIATRFGGNDGTPTH